MLMWVILLFKCQRANLYCKTSDCNSCLDKYLYRSISCLDICPTGFTLDVTSSRCQESDSKLLFALDFLNYSVFKANSIGNFSHPDNSSFNDPSRKTPIPTLQTGFYFAETSFLESKTSWIPAPDFSVYLITKLNTTTGKVFRIMNESIEIFSIWLDKNLYVKWLLTKNSSQIYYNTSISIDNSNWMNLQFSSVQSADLLTIKIINITTSKVQTYLIQGAEFRCQFANLKYLIGDRNSSFKGMISWLSAENSEKSTFRKFIPIIIRSEGQATTNQAYCNFPSCTWPWCINNFNCNLFSSVHCKNGTGFLPKDCTLCSLGTSPFCGLRYECLIGSILNCSSCSKNYSNIEGFCVISPTFLNETNLEIPVIDAKFYEIGQYYGGIFQSGFNESTYAPFNNPDDDDPWPVKYRGLFFNRKHFLKIKNRFDFNYKFTIAIWSRSELPSMVLDGNQVNLRGDYNFKITFRSTNYFYQAHNKNMIDYQSKWIFFHVSMNQIGITSELKWYLNLQLFETFTIDGFSFAGSNKGDGRLDVGRWESTTPSFWKGCIYRLTIWQTAIEDLSSVSNICGLEFGSDCLWNCSGTQYYDPVFKKCFNCDSPCSNCSTFGSCNLCSNIQCETCSSFTSECSVSQSNPCLNGFFLSSDGKCCQEPCLTCYMSGPASCLSCKAGCFLYGNTCIQSCPSGFTINNSMCTAPTGPFISLSLDTINNSVIDSVSKVQFSAGSNSSFYPALDESDPWPAMRRGFYFTPGKYLTSSPLNFEYNLTFEFWVKLESFGTIFFKKNIGFSAGSSTEIIISSVGIINFAGIPLNTWVHILFAMATNPIKDFSGLLLIDTKVDQVSIASKQFMDNLSPFYLGNLTKTFTGFLWSFSIYYEFRTIFDNQFVICTKSSAENCTWNCEINKFLDQEKCVQCKSECHGCRRAEDCNLCQDRLCLKCSNFYLGCIECIENAEYIDSLCQCKAEYIWNNCTLSCMPKNLHINNDSCVCQNGMYGNGDSCLPCFQDCETCSGPSQKDCLTCRNSFGYILEENQCIPCHTSCKTCNGSQYFECNTCKDKLWYLLKMCYPRCPLGFKENSQFCIESSAEKVVAKFEFKSFYHEYSDKINALTIRSNDFNTVLPTVDRGVYFTGENSGLRLINNEKMIIFSPSFCVSCWFNLYSDSPLFEYSILNQSFQVYFELGVPIFNISLSFSEKFESSLQAYNKNWNHLLACTEFKDFFTFSLTLNKITSSRVVSSKAAFKDSFNSSLLIGYSLFSNSYFHGFLFSLSLFKSKPAINDLVTEKCNSCYVCDPTNDCLSICNINEYQEDNLNCSNCSNECTSGCRNSKNCSLCVDQGCIKCRSFEKFSCLECSNGYELVDGECKECSTEEFYKAQDKSCQLCRSLCTSCSEESTCLTCKENSLLSLNKQCECAESFIEIGNECIRKRFTAFIQVSDGRKFNLGFSEILMNDLRNEDFMIAKHLKTLEFKKVKITSSLYLLEIIASDDKDLAGTCSLIFIQELHSAKDSILYPLNYSFNLPDGSKDSSVQEIEEMKSSTESMARSTLVSVFGLSLISGDFSSFFTFLNAVEIFSYVILFNKEFDPLMVAFLNALRPSSIIPNLFELIVPESSGRKLGKKFKDFGIETHLLLLNAGMYYLAFSLFFILLLFKIVISYIRHQNALKLKLKLEEFLIYSAFVRLWIQSCLEVMIASVLGIIERQINDLYSGFDFFLCIVSIILNGFCFIVLLRSIFQIRNTRFEEIKSKFRPFFEEFNCRGIDDVLFYVVFVLRRFSLCFIIFFADVFVIQIIIAMCFALAIPFYIIFRRPFKENLLGWNIVCLEILICIFYSLILLSSLSFHFLTSRELANICIQVVIAGIFCNIGFSTLITTKKIIMFFKRRCSTESEFITPTKISTKTHVIKEVDLV